MQRKKMVKNLISECLETPNAKREYAKTRSEMTPPSGVGNIFSNKKRVSRLGSLSRHCKNFPIA